MQAARSAIWNGRVFADVHQYKPQAPRGVASEPADNPSTVVAQQALCNFFSYSSWGKAKFVSSLRIGATSLVLTYMWVQQAHTQVASRQAPENGPKTLLEAVNGTDSGQANERGNDDERLDPDRPHFPEATTTVGKDRVMLESGVYLREEGQLFFVTLLPRGAASRRNVCRLVRISNRTELSARRREDRWGDQCPRWCPRPLSRHEARVNQAKGSSSSHRGDPTDDGTNR